MAKPDPHLNKVRPEDLPENINQAREKSMALRGDGTFFEVFGNHPDLYKWYIDRFYQELFYAERIEQSIKELLRYKLSTLHGCKFCNQGNRLEALAAGLSQEQIDHFDDFENGPFTEKEKEVLRLAEQMAMTNPNGQLTKENYQGLSKHFTDAEILELGMIMGILTGIAKFIFVFDLVEKEDYCQFNHSSQKEK